MIRTKRLFIDTLKTENANSYFKIAKKSNTLLCRYTPFFIAYSQKHAIEIIQSYSGPYSYMYGIWKNDKTLIGAILYDHFFSCDFIAVSYFIGKKYRGNGYIVEAINGLTKNFSENPYDADITNLRFCINSDNNSSIRVQQKLNSIEIDSSSKETIKYMQNIL